LAPDRVKPLRVPAESDTQAKTLHGCAFGAFAAAALGFEAAPATAP